MSPHNDESLREIPNARQGFDFHHPWFELIRPHWEYMYTNLMTDKRKLKILEVGSFEGASTTWILDNLLEHPESSLHAVDHFQGGMEHNDGTDDKYSLDSLEARFHSNVSKCKNVSKLTVVKDPSDSALMKLRQQNLSFDLIYIDASHVAIDVLHDAVLAWRMLEVGGTLVFDDFTWQGYLEECYNPRIAIVAFLRCTVHEAVFRETESQIWVTKVPRRITPTPNPDPQLFYAQESLREFMVKMKAQTGPLQ